MPELWPLVSGPRTKTDTVRVVDVATRQWGVISRTQLLDCGLSSTGINRWIARRQLHRIHHGVYALGHKRIPTAGRCVAALLHAGPSAALSHLTAAWWWGLIETEPKTIEMSSSKHARSVTGIRVHRPRKLQSVRHRGMAVTPVVRTLRDIAFLLPARGIRRSVSEADYRRLLDPAAAERQLGRGRPGAAALRPELERFDPMLG